MLAVPRDGRALPVMPKLILQSDVPSRFTIGGKPSAPPGTKWPVCASCGAAMQFVAQLPASEHDDAEIAARGRVVLLFQCQADPGMCDEWDPDEGGNAALCLDGTGCQPMEVPDGATLLDGESRLAFRHYDDARRDETDDDHYSDAVCVEKDPALGKIGGRPVWVQGDETPDCGCGAPMQFFAQLEYTGGGGINFGDAGSGYAFLCRQCPDRAKFLWQC